MFTQKGCGHCERAKTDFKNDIKEGRIIEAPVENKGWMSLASKLNVTGTPTLFKVKSNGNGKIKPENIEISGACDIEEYRKTGSCKGKYPFV